MLTSGTKVGPYEIVSPLGAGGMGEVYRARDTRLGRDVAIKVLPPAFAADTERMRRFEQEARAVGMLNHPNILAVYDLGTHEGSPYLVTELLEGETLREAGALPQRKALDYAQQLARGLAAAHEKNITHRDMKPENIFITRDERVKILDFGLAKLTQKEESLSIAPTTPAATIPGTVLGTAGYMSPEQVVGAAADHRSDIFSFGTILYEMISSKRAFTGEATVEVMTAILRSDPPELPNIAIERIARRCLEKRPERRFQSASDLAFALEALSGSTVAAPGAQLGLGVRGQGLGRAAIVGAVCAAIFLLAGMWIQARRTPAVTVWTGVQLGGSRIAFGPRLSPDGRTLAFLAVADGQSQVAVMHPGSANWTVLTHQRKRGGAYALCWSRDSSKIYFSRFDSVPRGIYSVPALGGEERLILEDAQSPELLQDGSFVVSRINAARAYQIFHFWPESGRMEAMNSFLYGLSEYTFPDGKEVVFYGQSPKPEPPQYFYSLNLASGAARRLAPELKAGLSDGFPNAIGIEPGGRSFLASIRSGDSYRVVRVFRDGSGYAETSLSLTFPAFSMDVGADGSLYSDQADRPFDLLRVPIDGGEPEKLTSAKLGSLFPDGLLLPDGRTLFSSELVGRKRVIVTAPAADPIPFVESDEETSGPMTLLNGREVVFLVGSGADRVFAIVSLEDGRIRQRLSVAKGAEIAEISSSPDGKTLYYLVGLPGVLWSAQVTGGEPHRIASADGIAVDPDGLHLVLLRGEKDAAKLSRLTLADGSEIPIPASSEYSISSLPDRAIGKDGRILVNVALKDSMFASPAILDPKTGAWQRIHVKYDGDVWPLSWTPDGKVFAVGWAMRSTLWRFRH